MADKEDLLNQLELALIVEDEITFSEVLKNLTDWLDFPVTVETEQQRQVRIGLQSRLNSVETWLRGRL